MVISGGTKGCLGVLQPGQDLGQVVHDHPWEWVSVAFRQAIWYLFKSKGPLLQLPAQTSTVHERASTAALHLKKDPLD